jgi:hypothetical protein
MTGAHRPRRTERDFVEQLEEAFQPRQTKLSPRARYLLTLAAVWPPCVIAAGAIIYAAGTR